MGSFETVRMTLRLGLPNPFHCDDCSYLGSPNLSLELCSMQYRPRLTQSRRSPWVTWPVPILSGAKPSHVVLSSDYVVFLTTVGQLRRTDAKGGGTKIPAF